MGYLPLNIDMRNRKALIIGGGRVAGRKAEALRKAGAEVHVVSPEVSGEISFLATAGCINLRTGLFEPSDMDEVFLVITATGDADVNAAIAAEARARGILVAVTDAPDRGDCIFPALLQRGDLEITVSSGGKCPAFSAQIRDLIAGYIGEDYGAALERIAQEREKLLTEGNDSTYNARIVRCSVQKAIVELLNRKGMP